MAAGRDLRNVQHICDLVSLESRPTMTAKYHENGFYYWPEMHPSSPLRAPLAHPAAHSFLVAVAEPLLGFPNAFLKEASRVQVSMSSLVLRFGEVTEEIYRERHYLLLLSAVEQHYVPFSFFALPSVPRDIPCKIFLAKCERIVSFRFSSCSFDI